MSKKNKKATSEPMSPMAEALGQSADEETAKRYCDSLSAEQQLVNSTDPNLESCPHHLDPDYMHRNFQRYAPGSPAWSMPYALDANDASQGNEAALRIISLVRIRST